jgi:hypothetical protein
MNNICEKCVKNVRKWSVEHFTYKKHIFFISIFL